MRLALAFLLAATPALAQDKIANPDAPGVPALTHSADTGLPYFAEGRGIVDHEALRRRSLEVLEHQFGAYRDASAALNSTATAFCDGDTDIESLQDALRDAWVAWAPLDSYQFGPISQMGAALTVNFWPDKKNFVGRGLDQLANLTEEQQRDPDAIATLSAAAQGLPALERLIWSEDHQCPGVIGISAFQARFGQDLYDAWFAADGWADLALAAGPDNPVYLSPREFTKTLYTALDFGLTRIIDTRLGRPLGTFEQPWPERAEAWRSGLSLDIIHAQLDGIGEMIRDGFAGDITEPDRNWVLQVVDQTHGRLDAIDGTLADAVRDPETHFTVEAAQTKALYLQGELAREIGPELGVETGFSAADGD